jgi:uncharacterized delta-60 repeat protein
MKRIEEAGVLWGQPLWIVMWMSALLLGCGGDGSGSGGSAGSGGAGGAGGALDPGVSLSVDGERIRVRQGEAVGVTINVTRTGGFEGAVDIELSGVLSEVTAAPLTIESGASSGILSVVAAAGATQGGPTEVTVSASATSDGSVNASTSADLYVAGPPGSLDSSFSFDGVVRYSVTDTQYDAPRGIAIDSQGRIVVVGVQQGDPDAGWVVRFLPDGTIDSSFGTNGEVLDFENEQTDSTARAVALRDDDAPLVLAASYVASSGDPATWYLRALSSDGARDTTYGLGGDALVSAEGPRSVVLRPAGAVAFGYAQMSAFDDMGSPIGGFVVPLSPPTSFNVAASDSQDRLVFGGFGDDDFILSRLLPDGALDSTFGTSGALTSPIPVGHEDATVNDIALDDDGGGVAIAESNFGNIAENRPVLLRFDADGTLEPGFGSGGIAPVLAVGEEGYGEHVFLEEDGSVVASGAIHLGGAISFDPVVKRFFPDGSPDASFGTGGQVLIEEFPRGMAHDVLGGRVVILADQPGMDGGIHLTRIWL